MSLDLTHGFVEVVSTLWVHVFGPFDMSHFVRKSVFGFPTRSDTNRTVQLRLEISGLGSRGILQFMQLKERH